MRIHRFFSDRSLSRHGRVTLEDKDLIHQWRHVLRFQPGQEVILYDNSGFEYKAIIEIITNKLAEVEITGNRPAVFAPVLPLYLFLGLAKRQAFEWTLEKGTELGVAGFCPVVTEHSEKKKINIDRSRLIIREACEQSHRSILPEIYETVDLEESLQNLSGVTFALDPTGEPFKSAVHKNNGRVNVFIGPEGGFSPSELELFKQNKIPIYSMGKQVMRAETAAVAISSVLLLS